MLVSFFKCIGVAVIGLFIFSCKRQDSTGTLDLRMTNTLLLDDSVQGVYITISDLYVDGEAFRTEELPRVVNLLDLEQDTFFMMGVSSVLAKMHTHIRLVVDNAETPDGNSPGSYVQWHSGAKYPLSASTETEFIASNAFTVPLDGSNTVSIEINLRKAIQKDSLGNYRWRSADVLRHSFRSFSLRNAGLVKGTCTIPPTLQNAKIVLHGYLKGSYLGAQELSPDEQGLTFPNALVSTTVNADGSYVLGYIPESQLVLLIARYEKVNGEWVFQSFLSGAAYDSSNQPVSLYNIVVAPGVVTTIRLEL